ncbi:hypothetical protein [Aeromonas veronii]
MTTHPLENDAAKRFYLPIALPEHYWQPAPRQTCLTGKQQRLEQG